MSTDASSSHDTEVLLAGTFEGGFQPLTLAQSAFRQEGFGVDDYSRGVTEAKL